MISIFGKSGSGKSTLLNIVSLLDKPNEGVILFKNESTKKWSEKKVDRFHFQNLGIVFQQYNLIESESGEYNINLAGMIGGLNKSEINQRIDKLCQFLSIRKSLLKQKCQNLSGGEKQRVGILRSLINEPDIIVADEPTGALDINNSIAVMKLLKEISKEKLVIIVSHNKELVEQYSDEIITLVDGKLESIKKGENNDKKNKGISLVDHKICD